MRTYFRESKKNNFLRMFEIQETFSNFEDIPQNKAKIQNEKDYSFHLEYKNGVNFCN